jgi:hypothetical protein
LKSPRRQREAGGSERRKGSRRELRKEARAVEPRQGK